MPAVFTNRALALFAEGARTGRVLRVDQRRYGTLAAASVVDATADATAMQDTTPDTGVLSLDLPAGVGTQVHYRLQIQPTGSVRNITEVGLWGRLYNDATPIGVRELLIYEADANTVLIPQTAVDIVTKVLAYQVLQAGSATGLTLDLEGAQRDELYSNDAFAWVNKQIKSFTTAYDWTNYDILEIYIEGSNDRNFNDYFSVPQVEAQDALAVGSNWYSNANNLLNKITAESNGLSRFTICKGATDTELRMAVDVDTLTGKVQVHGIKYRGLQGPPGQDAAPVNAYQYSEIEIDASTGSGAKARIAGVNAAGGVVSVEVIEGGTLYPDTGVTAEIKKAIGTGCVLSVSSSGGAVTAITPTTAGTGYGVSLPSAVPADGTIELLYEAWDGAALGG